MIAYFDRARFLNDELYILIKSKYKTISNFAEVLETSSTNISIKLNNRSGMSREEIMTWCKLLDIEKSDIGRIFFSVAE